MELTVPADSAYLDSLDMRLQEMDSCFIRKWTCFCKQFLNAILDSVGQQDLRRFSIQRPGPRAHV